MSNHLIGAFGLFWQRDEVFGPHDAGERWQLLGRRNQNKGALRVCDFRRARGFYLLYNDYGATYVGLASGAHGLGQRLKAHDQDKQKDWSRFSWFSFDNVEDWPERDGWSRIVTRNAVENVSTRSAVGEFEALLIQVLGTRSQNQMRFTGAERWEQIFVADYAPGFLMSRVDRRPIKSRLLASYLEL
ncbi:hypothetical protein [Klenkia brasiliensis]|uniref:GIY-YIG domain-containing protein n=1 Tax=Klenkia brasiliensis TaxID=333142 RepID=A0A1G7TKL5_9ACTN|nr:hypothetical protein [Klenkia brasiliensis]SDG35866.1 hypothetical protein SAMN05660324_2518 [Klenkia brasiliensis]